MAPSRAWPVEYGLIDQAVGPADQAGPGLQAAAAADPAAGATTAFREPFVPSGPIDAVAGAAHLKLRTLDPLTGPPPGGWPRQADYIRLMEANLGALNRRPGLPRHRHRGDDDRPRRRHRAGRHRRPRPASAGERPESPRRLDRIDRPFAWASVTKVLTALAVWVAVEEGTAAWDEPAGPPGATVGHLLAHASGLAPDRDAVLAAPGTRRIYSNRGFEVAGRPPGGPGRHALRRLRAGRGDRAARIERHRAARLAGIRRVGPLVDLLTLGRELLTPTLVSAGTVAAATSVAFPGLAGVLPGFGRQDPNDWGLGVEIRDGKSPHWTGRRNSPRTFGHFGQSGSFLWVDPVASWCSASSAIGPFGPWATSAWPALSDAVVVAYGRPREQCGTPLTGVTGPRS